MSLEIVILAAGQGTRMRSALPKVLHPIAGKPMLGHVIDCARQLQPERIHVVIGHGADLVRERMAADDLNFVLQAEQLGTGHAVAQALPFLSADQVLILYGDVPLIQLDTLQRLLAQVTPDQLSLLTVDMLDPTGYGRIVRDDQGAVQAIVEHKDATPAQRQIGEINTGILAVPGKRLADWLGRLSNDNAQGEYYLTDVIAMAVGDGLVVASAQPLDAMEVQGVNDRMQQAQLERHYQRLRAEELMRQGVTLLDPQRLDVRGEISVGRDVLIDVNVVLEGRVVIEDDVRIGPNCVIRDSVLRRGAVIKANSHLEGAELGEGSDAGPFARLRPGSVLGARAHVGNFVELKNARLGEGSKAGHLSYLGDAELGANCNIGAGTITCNYDGANKFRTELGDDVFIGSNNSLVAPLKIGDGATTAAGSTITHEVPAKNLAFGRARRRTWKTGSARKKSRSNGAARMPKPAKWIVLGLLIAWAVLPEWPRIPVEGASARDWNPRTFWFEPWGRSGVHKGIDIFARSGTPVRSASYGLVLYRGEIALGGKVVLVLAPKWRLHYYAHLDSLDTYPGQPVLTGSRLGTVGTTGNARGKPAHLHYAIITLLPYPWLADASTQGWKKMFYLDPNTVLPSR